MASQPIPDPPATPNSDAWVEVSRGENGVRYCSDDGSATIWLELVSDGGRKRWEWTNHNVYVGLNLWELQADWEREPADVAFDPLPDPKSAPVSLTVPEQHRGRAAPEPEPIPVEAPQERKRPARHWLRKTVEHTGEAVDPVVERAAKAIAEQVRGAMVISRAELYERSNPEYVDRCLTFAVAMEWCVLDGIELIRPGRVNHRPVTPIGDVDGPSWGPDETVGLFRTAPARLG